MDNRTKIHCSVIMELDELPTHDDDNDQADRISASGDEATEQLIQVSIVNSQRSLGLSFDTEGIGVSMDAGD